MKRITLKANSFPKEQIAKMLQKNNILVNQYAETFFAHSEFSTEHLNETVIIIMELRELGFENGATLCEIFHKIEGSRFMPCSLNTGLFLRLAWRDQPRSQNLLLSGIHQSPDQAVIVLTKIIEGDVSFPKGLYLRNVDGKLWLRGYVCDSLYRFSGNDLFAFEERA